MPNATRKIDASGMTTTGAWLEGDQPLPSKFAAIAALTQGRHVVYAMRLPDGIIKIGCCKDLGNRSYGLGGQILGFRFGDFDDEAEIHRVLIDYRARGHEYYHPAPEVMKIVNSLRDEWGLPHVAS